jgi:hypothetical protein
MNVLKKADLLKTYSFEKMIIQLKKLNAIAMDNDQIIISELKKKLKALLQSFNIMTKS